MPNVSASITINQAVEKVFEYVTNVENHTAWQEGIVEATITPDGPVAVGSTYKYVSEVMGNRMESAMEVTGFEENKLWTVATTGVPTSVSTSYQFEGAGDATNLIVSMAVPDGAYPAAAEAAVMGQMKTNLEAQCQRMKAAVE